MKKLFAVLLIEVLIVGGIFAESQPVSPAGSHPKKAQVEMSKGGHLGGGKKGSSMSDKQRAKLRAEREAQLRKAAKAIQKETDPVKKQALIDQLRTKLTQDAQRMLVSFRKRLESAENEVLKMKKRLAEAEKNRDRHVEEKLQRILSGDPPPRLRGKNSEGEKNSGRLNKKSIPVSK